MKKHRVGRNKIIRSDIRPERIDFRSLAKNTGKVILMLAALGVAVSVVAIAPNLPAAFAELAGIFEKTPRRRRRQAIRRLEKQRLIEIVERGGNTTITVTERGKQRVASFNLEHLCIAQPERWDKKWRVITFDVPERFSAGRRTLREKIRGLNFYPLQKSVFVYPHPCKDEIDFIADFFGIGRYLNYIEATHIDDEGYLKKYFNLG